MQQLFARVFGQLGQRVLVDTLANSRTFQRMAVRTNEATQAAKAEVAAKAAEMADQAVKQSGGASAFAAGDEALRGATKSVGRFVDGVVRAMGRE